MRISKAVCGGALLSVSMPALANKDLERLPKEDTNWVMQTKDYSASHLSNMTQINAHNVQHLQPVWSFSTGVLNGHEDGPLVVGGIMYVHTPFPNNIFAIALDEPGKILWEYKPKQNPAARAVACCDVVNRHGAFMPRSLMRTLNWQKISIVPIRIMASLD